MNLESTIQLFSTSPQTPQINEILKRFQAEAPVDVKGLAGALGVNVWELHSLPPSISGKIWKDERNGGSSGFSIGVNASEPFVRKRFTVAHEIAHFLLHRNLITNELLEDTMYRGLGGREEAQANKLAADILMPYPLINRLMANGLTDVDALASLLQVSGIAMRIRLGIPVT
jgi:IrrE N-terminal-like domain